MDITTPHTTTSRSTLAASRPRRRLLGIVVAAAATSALATTPAMAGNPHFIKNASPGISMQGSAMSCSFKEAGLASGSVETITCAATAEVSDSECVNGGGNTPSAANKHTVQTFVSASGEFKADRNGTGQGSVGARRSVRCGHRLLVPSRPDRHSRLRRLHQHPARRTPRAAPDSACLGCSPTSMRPLPRSSRTVASRGAARWAAPSTAGANRLPSRPSRAKIRPHGGRRVAVVGAGPAGLAALRALTARGLDATAFERGGRVGGVWTLEDRPTAAYRSLHLITSRAAHGVRRAPDAGRHAGLPEPRRGRALARGLRRALRPRRRGSASAPRSRPRGAQPGGGWEVETAGGDARALRRARRRQRPQRGGGVAEPAVPGLRRVRRRAAARARLRRRAGLRGPAGDGRRHGQQRDGHRHRPLALRRADAAVRAPRELGHPQAAARQARRPGHPAVGRRCTCRGGCASRSRRRCCKLTVGRPEDVGLPAPDGGLFQSHPTISDTIVSRIAHGRITPKPGIEALEPRRRALHRRHARGRRRDRLVHGLPRRRSRSSTRRSRRRTRRRCASTSASCTSTSPTCSSSG